jgi:hypothetical protein
MVSKAFDNHPFTPQFTRHYFASFADIGQEYERIRKKVLHSRLTMLRRILPYHLLFIALAAITVLFWGKIHKHSFYRHYFRVTSDVEVRNSCDLSPALFAAGRVQMFVQQHAPTAGSGAWMPALVAHRACVRNTFSAYVQPIAQRFALPKCYRLFAPTNAPPCWA